MTSPESLFGVQVWALSSGWTDTFERYLTRQDAREACRGYAPGVAVVTAPGVVGVLA